MRMFVTFFFLLLHTLRIFYGIVWKKNTLLFVINLFSQLHAIILIAETISSIIPACNYFRPRRIFFLFCFTRRVNTHSLFIHHRKTQIIQSVIESVINARRKRRERNAVNCREQMDESSRKSRDSNASKRVYRRNDYRHHAQHTRARVSSLPCTHFERIDTSNLSGKFPSKRSILLIHRRICY